MLGIQPGAQHSCISDKGKCKGMVLYSAVSSPLDRSKRFTLDTLKPVGPFYGVYRRGSNISHTEGGGGGKYVTIRGFHIQALHIEKGNYLNHSCVSPKNGLFGVYKTNNVSADQINTILIMIPLLRPYMYKTRH